MYYTVYKITNKLNNKIYIGVHKTNNLDDGYMGSGKHLKRSLEKYGIENFEKEILHIFDNQEDMFSRESELVNEEFVARDDTYNLKEGGSGGWDYVNDNYINTQNRDYKKKYLDVKDKLLKASNDFWKNSPDEVIENVKSKRVRTLRERYGDDAFKTFEGKRHTQDTLNKMSKAKKGKYKGRLNPAYGTIWVFFSGRKTFYSY
ncbi:putative homing endonuclease [Vibrio phage phiKT1024]|nr:putative homing endonuclease [Vibrio phage phiKT1024]